MTFGSVTVEPALQATAVTNTGELVRRFKRSLNNPTSLLSTMCAINVWVGSCSFQRPGFTSVDCRNERYDSGTSLISRAFEWRRESTNAQAMYAHACWEPE